MKKHNILITNDDGYISSGLLALRDELNKFANVVCVAPAREKSACGHGLTLSSPLKLIEVEKDFYKLDDGGPTDCIYLALSDIYGKDHLPLKPDLIISGINLGSNMGEDTTYSGTVAGAMEGALKNIPSIAISQLFNKDAYKNLRNKQEVLGNFALARRFIATFVQDICDKSYPLGVRRFLNVNIPPLLEHECRGIQIVELGRRTYKSDTQANVNPRNEKYFWLGMHPLEWKKRSELTCDFEATSSKYISITPLKLNLTSYEDLETLSNFTKGVNLA